MELLELMKKRHSVRNYLDKEIEPEKITLLNKKIDEINTKSGLSIKMFIEEPNAFKANKTHYGKFSGCKNYFVICGKKGMDEKVGYYGEELVLFSQSLDLNTCWVALTYDKASIKPSIEKNEKIYIVISLGYGTSSGTPHKSRDAKAISNICETSPDWFKNGIEAALLAPTAMNQQKYYLELNGNVVTAKAKSLIQGKVDLGIIKYHFEVIAGKDNFKWDN